MNFPLTGDAILPWGVVFGIIFGFLIHRGGVANYNVIVNQFRLKDFTMLRVMLTALVIGGIGIWVLSSAGLAVYHIKSADLVAVALGSAIFGVGMVLYGYCPGTGIAAIATGSIHALVGFAGMLVGGILFAYTYPWLNENVIPLYSFGKVRLPELTGVGDGVWLGILTVVALSVFAFLKRFESRQEV